MQTGSLARRMVAASFEMRVAIAIHEKNSVSAIFGGELRALLVVSNQEDRLVYSCTKRIDLLCRTEFV